MLTLAIRPAAIIASYSGAAESKGVLMTTPSLSIIVPVLNQQATLAAFVSQLLDAAEEVAASFEIVLVDDGSTDHSSEIIADLAVRFPQVRAEYHARSRGNLTVESATRRARGSLVVVQHPLATICSTTLRHKCMQAKLGDHKAGSTGIERKLNRSAPHDVNHSTLAIPHAFENRVKRNSRDVSGICPPRYQV